MPLLSVSRAPVPQFDIPPPPPPPPVQSAAPKLQIPAPKKMVTQNVAPTDFAAQIQQKLNEKRLKTEEKTQPPMPVNIARKPSIAESGMRARKPSADSAASVERPMNDFARQLLTQKQKIVNKEHPERIVESPVSVAEAPRVRKASNESIQSITTLAQHHQVQLASKHQTSRSSLGDFTSAIQPRSVSSLLGNEKIAGLERRMSLSNQQSLSMSKRSSIISQSLDLNTLDEQQSKSDTMSRTKTFKRSAPAPPAQMLAAPPLPKLRLDTPNWECVPEANLSPVEQSVEIPNKVSADSLGDVENANRTCLDDVATMMSMMGSRSNTMRRQLSEIVLRPGPNTYVPCVPSLPAHLALSRPDLDFEEDIARLLRKETKLAPAKGKDDRLWEFKIEETVSSGEFGFVMKGARRCGKGKWKPVQLLY